MDLPDFMLGPSINSQHITGSQSNFRDELYDEGYFSVQSTVNSCESYDMPASQPDPYDSSVIDMLEQCLPLCSYQENHQTHTPASSAAHCSSVQEIPVSSETAIAATVQEVQQPLTLVYTLKVLDQSDAFDKFSAGFSVKIPPGGETKGAPWAVS
jgi:hypothetical protein